MKNLAFILALLMSFSVFAQSSTVSIRSSSAKVYSTASTKAEVLVTLKRGNKVTIVGVTENKSWVKVKVVVSGFEFDGWVQRSAITKPKSTRSVAKRTKKKTSSSGLKKSSTSDLDKFFEPAGSSSSNNLEAKAAKKKKPKKAKKKKTASKKKKSSTPGKHEWIAGRLKLYGAPGYSFLQYKFSDDLTDAFRYNLSGPSIQLGAEYQAIELFKDIIQLRAQLLGQYSFMGTKTNLLDGSNVQFGDLTAKNMMLQILVKAKIMVDFNELIDKPFLAGITAGYDYWKFFADDIIDDLGVPVGLFVGQSVRSIPVGVVTELYFMDPVAIIIGGDLLINSNATESPSGSSGSQPNAKIGIAPYLRINFPVAQDKHIVGFAYRFRLQEVTFTGPSTSRVNNELNEASVLQSIHTLGIEYTYNF